MPAAFLKGRPECQESNAADLHFDGTQKYLPIKKTARSLSIREVEPSSVLF